MSYAFTSAASCEVRVRVRDRSLSPACWISWRFLSTCGNSDTASVSAASCSACCSNSPKPSASIPLEATEESETTLQHQNRAKHNAVHLLKTTQKNYKRNTTLTTVCCQLVCFILTKWSSWAKTGQVFQIRNKFAYFDIRACWRHSHFIQKWGVICLGFILRLQKYSLPLTITKFMLSVNIHINLISYYKYGLQYSLQLTYSLRYSLNWKEYASFLKWFRCQNPTTFYCSSDKQRRHMRRAHSQQ